MRLVKGEYTIALDYREAREIAFAVHNNLTRSIKEHYNSLQQSKDGELLFFKQQTIALEILKLMCPIGGMGIREMINEYKGMFKTKRDERILKEKGL